MVLRFDLPAGTRGWKLRISADSPMGEVITRIVQGRALIALPEPPYP